MNQTIVPIIIVFTVLLSASVYDLKRREVPDIHWWIIGITGIFSMIIFNDVGPMQWPMVAGTVLILTDILVDLGPNRLILSAKYIAIAILFAIPIIFSYSDPLTQQFAAIPICYLSFYGLYLTGILKGGADAKCLIVISMAFQKYPELSGTLIPVPESAELMIMYPLALLFHAALFSLTSVLYVVFVKIRNSESLTVKTASTYGMPIEKAKKSHVWLKQDVVGGIVVDVPEADNDAYGRLEKLGVNTVKVSMIIPFIVPITTAFVFMLTVGNILFIPFI